MYSDQLLAKQSVDSQKRSALADSCNDTTGIGRLPSTMGEQAEKNAAYHREQANKNEKAAAFLNAHPEFEEFVRLVRVGAIQY